MATKTEVSKAVLKILSAYPQLKFSAESIAGFVDLLAEKLKDFPGWIMDEAADRFITTEIDFPRFNLAAVLDYCYRIRDDKTAVLKNKLQSIKDKWYAGEACTREEMVKLAADFVSIGAMEWANSVRERVDTYTHPIKQAPPKKIAEATRKIQAAWQEEK